MQNSLRAHSLDGLLVPSLLQQLRLHVNQLRSAAHTLGALTLWLFTTALCCDLFYANKAWQGLLACKTPFETQKLGHAEASVCARDLLCSL